MKSEVILQLVTKTGALMPTSPPLITTLRDSQFQSVQLFIFKFCLHILKNNLHMLLFLYFSTFILSFVSLLWKGRISSLTLYFPSPYKYILPLYTVQISIQYLYYFDLGNITESLAMLCTIIIFFLVQFSLFSLIS